MKKSQLQDLIREAIQEILDEGVTYAGKDAVDDAQKDPKFGTLSGTGKADAINKLKAGGTVTIGENGLKEMARKSITYKLGDNYQEKLSQLSYFDSDKRMRWVNGIIDYITQEGSSDATTIAKEKFDVPQPRIADYVRDMIRLGILEPEGEGVVPQFLQPDEEREEPIRGGEEFLIGPYLDLGTSGTPDTDEEEPEEMEPEPDELEKTEPITKTGGVSDKDYQDWVKYSDYKERLNATKSNIQKVKRSKGIVDIGPDTKDEELNRLINLKNSLKDRIDALVASSKYLQDKEAKLSKKPTSSEPEEVEDEDIVAENYAYEKRQLQYRAGIIR